MAKGSGPEFKGRVGLDGEKEFKQAMANLSSSLRAVSAEMKVVDAEAKANGESASTLAMRNRLLTEQAGLQREKIAQVADMLAKAREAYGDGSTEVNRYRADLARNQAALVATEAAQRDNAKALEEMEAGMEEAGEAAEAQSEAMAQAAETVQQEAEAAQTAEKKHDGLKNAMAAVGSVAAATLVAGMKAATAAIGALTTAAAGAVAAGMNMTVSAATMADDLLTQSTVTGVSTQKLQEWSYAANFVDTDVSTITKSMSRMTKTMGDAVSGSKGAKDKFAALGVSITDADGRMRDAESVFMDAIDALGQVSNETQRDALAMDLFGKSAQELNPLIEAGGDALRELGEEARATGNVMSDDALASLGAFDDAMQRLKAGSTSLKNTIGAQLAPVFLPFANQATAAVSRVTAALRDGIQLGEMEKVTGELLTMAQDAISQGVSLITRALPLAQSALTGVIGQLAASLPALLEVLLPGAMELLQGIVNAIVTNIDPIAGMAVQLVGQVAQFLLSNAPMLLDSAVTLLTTLIDGIVEGLPRLIPLALEMLGSLGLALVQAIPALVSSLPAIVAAILEGLGNVDWATFGLNLLNGFVEGVRSAVGALIGAITSLWQTVWQAILDVFGIASPSTKAKDAAGFIFQGFLDGFTGAIGMVLDAVADIFGKIWDVIKSIFGMGGESEESKNAKQAGTDLMTGMRDGVVGSEDTLKKAVRNVSDMVLTELRSTMGIAGGTSTVTHGYGLAAAQGMGDGLVNAPESMFSGGAQAVAGDVASALNSAMGIAGTGLLGLGSQSASKFEYVGKAVAQGIAEGISKHASLVSAAATKAANSAYDAAKRALDIHSPSRRMEEIGKYYALGFSGGITQQTDTVVAAVRQLSDRAATGLPQAGAQGGIDYDRLAGAVVRANQQAGLGQTVLMVDGQALGATLEPSISRAGSLRASRTLSGRGARMIVGV